MLLMITVITQLAITTKALVKVGCTCNSSNTHYPTGSLNTNKVIVQLNLTLNITGTGYWHFKVEYKDKKEEGCKITRIGGLS